MMLFGFVSMLFGVLMLVGVRRGRLPKPGKWWTLMAVLTPVSLLVANTFGWIFAEVGRQPWIVQGVLPTSAAISPSVTLAEVATTLILFTLIYTALTIVEFYLMFKYARKGLPPAVSQEASSDNDDAPLSFAY